MPAPENSNVTTGARAPMARSDYQHDVRAPWGGGSRSRLPPYSGHGGPLVTTITGFRWPASDSN
eukprot:7281752-Pyramimonas_sp.AAC.1